MLQTISKIMKSSNLQEGASGRQQACKSGSCTSVDQDSESEIVALRDAAQATLEASISANWIDPALAQAAWVKSAPL